LTVAPWQTSLLAGVLASVRAIEHVGLGLTVTDAVLELAEGHDPLLTTAR
jgi:hypothetical protein